MGEKQFFILLFLSRVTVTPSGSGPARSQSVLGLVLILDLRDLDYEISDTNEFFVNLWGGRKLYFLF